MSRAHGRSSDFVIVGQDADCVFLVDLNTGGLSLTNDAESVVRLIFNRYGQKRIIYRDSEGRWDEMLHDKGVFIDYKPGDAETAERGKAIAAAAWY